jgi:hypothetical protein
MTNQVAAWVGWICNLGCLLECPVKRAFRSANERAALRKGRSPFFKSFFGTVRGEQVTVSQAAWSFLRGDHAAHTPSQ